jgi:hypothetical protein
MDALHNIFPEILYGDPTQFHSVPALIQYIQNQARRHYDLFSGGQREYGGTGVAGTPRPSQYIPPPSSPRPQVSRTHVLPTQAAAATPTPVYIRATQQQRPNIALNGLLRELLIPQQTDTFASSLYDLLNSLGTIETVTYPIQQQQQAFMDPVIVRPSAADIQNNTAIEIVDSTTEICAICQDEMPAGSRARALNACDHRFHVECIDTWFQRNVHCPICRSDIRERAPAVATNTAHPPSTPN